MKLQWIDGEFVVCKVKTLADVAIEDDFWFIARTDSEISVVCRVESLPDNCTDAESGWLLLRVVGPLDFNLTGVLAKLSGALAEAGIPIFAVSTFDTDYILVKSAQADNAASALVAAGYELI